MRGINNKAATFQLTSRTHKRTSFVELEGVVASVNGNTDGTNCGHCLLQSLLVTLGNVYETGVVSTNAALLESTFVVFCLIRVGGFSVKP